MPPNNAMPPTNNRSHPMSETIASAAMPGRAIAKIPSAMRTVPSTINHFHLFIVNNNTQNSRHMHTIGMYDNETD